MLAAIAFAIGTTVLIKMGKEKYMLITVIPLTFVAVTTLSAAFINTFTNYLPAHNYLLSGISMILVVMLVTILFESIRYGPENYRSSGQLIDRKSLRQYNANANHLHHTASLCSAILLRRDVYCFRTMQRLNDEQ